MIYIPNALALASIIASLRELVWSLRGGSDGGYSVSNLLVFAGLFGRSGGVANLKTVPIYQGVTDVFLRSNYATVPDETTANWDYTSHTLCDCPVCHSWRLAQLLL